MPSASSGVWPLGTGRRSGTTACAARDRMPRAEPRSGGPQAEHGEDPPVDVIRRRVQAAAIREDVTAWPETFPNSFLILLPQYFRSHLPISSSSWCRSAHHTKGAEPCPGPAPLCVSMAARGRGYRPAATAAPRRFRFHHHRRTCGGPVWCEGLTCEETPVLWISLIADERGPAPL